MTPTTPLAAALDAMIREVSDKLYLSHEFRSTTHLAETIANRAAELALREAAKTIDALATYEDPGEFCYASCPSDAVRSLLPAAGEFLRSELGGGTAKEIDRLRTQLAAARQSLIDRCDGLHFAGRLKEEKEWRRKIEEVFGP
jgi:Tfp pilus assembly protein PilX